MNKRISFSIAVLVFIFLAVAALVLFDDIEKNKEHADNYSSTSRAGGESTGSDNGAKSVSASGDGTNAQNGQDIFINPGESAAKEEDIPTETDSSAAENKISESEEEITPLEAANAAENKSNESEPVKFLKDFYSVMESQKDYAKTMGLLSSDFTLELNLLKQFGFNTLTKNDIDLETASLYSELLKSAKLESILKEETSEKSSKIYFYQSLSLDGERRFTIPMIAQLRKENGVWKIFSAREGNANDPPFPAAGQ